MRRLALAHTPDGGIAAAAGMSDGRPLLADAQVGARGCSSAGEWPRRTSPRRVNEMRGTEDVFGPVLLDIC